MRASVVRVDGLSAHADYQELLDWLAASDLSPRRVFVTHGEPAASAAFRTTLERSFGWNVSVPGMGAVEVLS